MVSTSPKLPNFLIPFVVASIDLVEKVFTKFVDYVITVDPILEEKFKQINKNTIIVSNFPKLSFFDNSINTNNSNLKDNTLIHVGGLAKIRGIIECMKAAAIASEKIDNIKLIFVGPITDSNLKKEIDELMKTVEKMRGEIHIISGEHDGGKKLDGLGGIGGLLRFRIS